MAKLTAISQLRLAFLGLSCVLLGPLYLLSRAIDTKLAAESRLRHEVVADRVFDELEREVNLVLERESARPSNAYDEPTDPKLWAPFMLGYFTVEHQRRRVMSTPALDDNRRVELERVTQELAANLALTNGNTDAIEAQSASQHSTSVTLEDTWPTGKPSPEFVTAPNKTKAALKSSPEILMQLNRAKEQRKFAPGAKKPANDPLQDYGF